jgi:hypothetical protein
MPPKKQPGPRKRDSICRDSKGRFSTQGAPSRGNRSGCQSKTENTKLNPGYVKKDTYKK